ncbi:uncharacterized protein [Littorina saxatilis]|uniref:uncharacterized protein n=1 Tax=Littorina saxatilis TaxID=31220 RepID=UPI0038B434F6
MTIMYDVACSFFAHLQKNAGTQNIKDCFKLVVPVFHSFAHSSNCQLTFGQRFVEGTGLVDGEGMERLWSYLRKFSGMTKEMSLPNRQDLLTDALLNYTRRNFYTTGQKLLVRLKRAKALQDSCLDLITKTELTEDGHVEEWLQRWKSNVQSRESTRITLSAEEQYCATLVLLEEKRQRLSSTDVIIQSDESTASIESLTKKAAKLQRDLRLEQAWSPCDSHVLEVANQAKAVKKAATLAKGNKLAVDRQHLLLNLRKYADGQKIASRLSRKMHENTQKLTVVLADLHDCGLHCALAEVKSVSSLLYKLPCPLSSEQIEAAKAFSEYERAKEEEESVLKDVQLFQSALLCLNRHLKDKIDQAKMSGGDSETAAGEGESSAGEDETSAPTVMQSLHLLHHSKFLLEMQIQSLRALFAQFTEAENESSIDKTVTKFLETSPVEESVQLYQSLLDNDLYLEAVDAIEDLDFSDISDQSDDDDDDGGGAS